MLAALCLGAGSAGDVESVMQQALEAHKAGRPLQALARLRQAIALIHEEVERTPAVFFPEPPGGWEARDVQAVRVHVDGVGYSDTYPAFHRTYTRKVDGARVEMELADWERLANWHRKWIGRHKDPGFLQVEARRLGSPPEAFQEGGWDGVKSSREGGDANLLAVCGIRVLSIRVSNGGWEARDLFWKLLDLEAMTPPAKPASTQPATQPSSAGATGGSD